MAQFCWEKKSPYKSRYGYGVGPVFTGCDEAQSAVRESARCWREGRSCGWSGCGKYLASRA